MVTHKGKPHANYQEAEKNVEKILHQVQLGHICFCYKQKVYNYANLRENQTSITKMLQYIVAEKNTKKI